MEGRREREWEKKAQENFEETKAIRILLGKE